MAGKLLSFVGCVCDGKDKLGLGGTGWALLLLLLKSPAPPEHFT